MKIKAKPFFLIRTFNGNNQNYYTMMKILIATLMVVAVSVMIPSAFADVEIRQKLFYCDAQEAWIGNYFTCKLQVIYKVVGDGSSEKVELYAKYWKWIGGVWPNYDWHKIDSNTYDKNGIYIETYNFKLAELNWDSDRKQVKLKINFKGESPDIGRPTLYTDK